MLKLTRFLLQSFNTLYVPLCLNTGTLMTQTAAYIVVFFMLDIFLRDGTSASPGFVGFLVAALFALFGLYYIFVFFYVRKAMSGGYRLAADLRTRACNHLRHLSLAFFRVNKPSTISGTLLHDMTEAEAGLGIYIYEMAACIIVPVVLGLIMLFMDWRLCMGLLSMLTLAIPFVVHSYRASGSDSPGYMIARANVDTTLMEYLTGMPELKGANRIGRLFEPFTKSSEHFLKLALAMEKRFSILGQIYLALLEFGFVIMMVLGSWFIAQGELSLAMFLFFLLLGNRLLEPLQNLGAFLTEFRYMASSMQRIADILLEKPLPVIDGYSEPLDSSIEFRDVFFAYGELDTLKKISFQVPEGTVTALVGESGGGKTTITNLLLRFWDVREGTISIGGTDIRTMSLEKLYDRFSVVFQDVYLFNDTVMNNIRMAKPDASDEEVVAAAKSACCHSFICNLEHKYETVVGERGSRLSGGERQRIAIARAILKDAPILILDEATASVDPENELQLQQGLTNLMQGRTLLVIAHRLTTIRQAHQILVLKGGAIVERGTHDLLLSQGSVYRGLWESQERLKSWKIGE